MISSDPRDTFMMLSCGLVVCEDGGNALIADIMTHNMGNA